MAALHLLAAQSTQLPRAVASVPSLSTASSPPPPPLRKAVAAPVYPYARATLHPLLSGSLRRGKWTSEEESYAAAIIQHFLSGVLPIQYGTTLRGYIAQLLHCDPMRVSKKLIPGSVFVGVRIDPKIGRRSYYPCPADTPGLDDHKALAENHLAQLRDQFIESIEHEEQQEQAAIHPQRSPPAGRIQSPLKRKRDPELAAPTVARFQQNRAPSLPSLMDVLRQNRPKAAAVMQGPVVDHEHHAYTSHGSASGSYQYATQSYIARYDHPSAPSFASFDRRHVLVLPHLGSAMYSSAATPY